MSAYICHPANVDTLVAIADDRLVEATARRIYPHSTPDSIEDARNLVARYLVSMNVRSVQYRYGGENAETLPGYGFDAWTTGTTYYPMPTDDAYTHSATRLALDYISGQRMKNGPHGEYEYPEFVAVARRVLGAARGFVYQSCELPEWADSPAAEFVTGVMVQVAHELAIGWTLDGHKETALEAVLT